MTPALLVLLTAAHAEDLGLWNGLVAPFGDANAVVEELDQLAEPLPSVAAGVELDPATSALLSEVRTALVGLDLATLHGLLPLALDGGSRGLRVTSEPGPTGMRVSMVERVGNPRELALGATQVDFRLTPAGAASRGDTWEVDGTGSMGIAQLTHDEIAMAVEGVLRELERAAGSDLALPPVCTDHAGLDDPAEEALLASIHLALPAVAKRLDAIIQTWTLAELKDGVLVVDVQGQLSGHTLTRAGYPSLGSWVDKLGPLLSVSLKVSDPGGRTVGRLSWRSQDGAFALMLKAHDGALVPWTQAGPVLDAAIRPTQDAVDLALSADMRMRDQGFVVVVDDLKAPVAWRSLPDRGVLGLALNRPPKVQITGSNAFVSMVADLADGALNLQGAADALFATATGDGGSTVRVRWVDGQAATTVVDAQLLDNNLVRFGARVAGRHMVPDDDAVADGVRVVGDLLRALEADYRAMRPLLLSAG